MADLTSMTGKIANRLGASLSQGQDSGLKKAERSHPLSALLGGENLIITEGAPGQKLGERFLEQVNKMLNNASANAEGLMMVLKAMADVNMAIAENLKPNEELQEELKERRKELQELQDRLKEDDQNYEDVLARFKEIFVDVQTEKLLDQRRAESHPIQA